MTVVMLVLPAHGHVNPTLPVAAELVARGERVIYFLTEEFAAAAAATGADVRLLSERFAAPLGLIPRLLAGPPEERAAAVSSFLAEMREESPALRERIAAEAPAGVVYDALGFWIGDVVRDLSTPRVAFFPSYAFPEGASLRDFFVSLSGASGVTTPLGASPMSATMFFQTPFTAEVVNIVPLPRSFQPNADAFDERYLFVGPMLRTHEPVGDFPLDQLAGRRVVFISLGTVVSDQPEFYRDSFAAFADSDWLVVAAIGRTDPAALDPLPPNVLAWSHVPQLAVLARSTVFVTHGGMNSTMEGLWQGVPLVVVPYQPEQQLTARRVTEMGLGRMLDSQQRDGRAVWEAVEAVAGDPAMRTRIAALQAEMRGAGGAPRAAAIQRVIGHDLEASHPGDRR